MRQQVNGSQAREGRKQAGRPKRLAAVQHRSVQPTIQAGWRGGVILLPAGSERCQTRGLEEAYRWEGEKRGNGKQRRPPLSGNPLVVFR